VGYWDDADGSYNATSDQRLKKDVVNIDESILSKVMQLKPVYYRLNHNETETKKTIGFLAQEVLPLFPELVKQNEEGFYSLHYADFGVIAIKVIQEQQIEIEELKKKVEEIDTLKAELELLKKMLIKNSDN
ncbi:MAG: tail fiber domain-containing protein, partial [Bacteroidota bacterium]